MVFSYHNHCLVSNPRLVSPSSCSKREKKCSIILAHLTPYTTKHTGPKEKKKKKLEEEKEAKRAKLCKCCDGERRPGTANCKMDRKLAKVTTTL